MIKCKPVQTAELQPPHACDLCEVCSWACHSNLGQCEYWWQGTEEGSLPCIVLFGNARLQRISITQLSLILKAQSYLLFLASLAVRGTGNKWGPSLTQCTRLRGICCVSTGRCPQTGFKLLHKGKKVLPGEQLRVQLCLHWWDHSFAGATWLCKPKPKLIHSY